MIMGAFEMDAAILVVEDVQGVIEQTREHVLLASSIGINNIVVFINFKSNNEEQLADNLPFIEADLEDLFRKHFPNHILIKTTESRPSDEEIAGKKEINIVVGSAKGAIEGEEKAEKAV